MCGIAGYVGWNRTIPEIHHDLDRMCGAIVHRGPDDEGRLALPGVALGMRRLSIIDVAAGQQPIGNETGSLQVVFNGEIYNHREIRSRLQALGHRFATHSDTEVLVHLYEEHSVRLVDHLRGMFGFALWDAPNRRLLVARDRLGIKPLYYWEHDGGVAFASELRSLLALERFRPDIDNRAIAAYLSLGYVPEWACIFQGVRKLPPGHWLTWSASEGVRVERYWDASSIKESPIGEQDAVVRLRELLDDCVKSHLESEVPLGAFLSGGLDSSAVVATMARHMSRPVDTFSIGFDEADFNEAADAAVVAKALGTNHTELVVRPDADALIDDVVRCYDEPFADSSALPTFIVCSLARQHVTVALSGDGGDEMFGGYRRYAERLLRARSFPSLLRPAVRAVAHALPFGTPGRNRLLDLCRTPAGRYAATLAAALPVHDGGIARRPLAGLVGSLDDIFAEQFAAVHDRDALSQMSLVDVATYLPGDILTKVDRASMAHSLEARVPLLDHRLAEFAMSLPGSLKFSNGTGKRIFRQAITGLVPPSVLEKRKQGFGVPLCHWFKGPLRYRIDQLFDRSSRIFEYVDPSAARRLSQEHYSGYRDHSETLWKLLALSLWFTHLDGGDLARPITHSSSAPGFEVALSRRRS